jgi:hypothetical protein
VLSQCATLIRRSGASMALGRLLAGGKVTAGPPWCPALRAIGVTGGHEGESVCCAVQSAVPGYAMSMCQCCNGRDWYTR